MIGKVIGISLLSILLIVVFLNREKIAAFGRKLSKFVGEIRAEMHKVSWPSQDQVIGQTIYVGLATFALMIFLSAMDSMFTKLLEMAYQ